MKMPACGTSCESMGVETPPSIIEFVLCDIYIICKCHIMTFIFKFDLGHLDLWPLFLTVTLTWWPWTLTLTLTTFTSFSDNGLDLGDLDLWPSNLTFDLGDLDLWPHFLIVDWKPQFFFIFDPDLGQLTHDLDLQSLPTWGQSQPCQKSRS